jgi:hypothetical protein
MSTRTERKKARKALRLAEENAQKAKRRLRLIGRWLGVPIGVLGAIATVLYFYPQFSLSKELPLDPSQVFSTPFVLRYDGWVPLLDVTVICGANAELTHGISITNITRNPRGNYLRVAWHDDVMTFRCDALTGSIVTADITLHVAYRVPLLGNFSIDRHFVSAQEVNGVLRWEAAPNHK